MQKSKLISLFKSLNREELKIFKEFVSSSYFNKNSNAANLLNYLAKYYGNYDSIKLNKETVYAELFPGKDFNIKVMKNLMSVLLRLGERFLEQNRYERNMAGRYNYLLEELLSRKLYPLFITKVKEAKELSSALKIDEVYFYNNLNLYSAIFDFDLRTRSGLEQTLNEELLLII